jgi:hypothetical protein
MAASRSAGNASRTARSQRVFPPTRKGFGRLSHSVALARLQVFTAAVGYFDCSRTVASTESTTYSTSRSVIAG